MTTMTTDKRNPPPKGGNDAPQMSVDVRDFGPIKEGRVELRPLTVFAGPSNTGKSWLSTLIYIMAKYTEEYAELNHFFSEREVRNIFELMDDQQSFPADLGRRWKEIVEHGIVRLSKDESKFIRQVVKFLLEENGSEEFLRCYGNAELNDLVRYGSRKSASVTVCIGDIKHYLTVSRKAKRISAKITIPSEMPIPVVPHTSRIPRGPELLNEYEMAGNTDETRLFGRQLFILPETLARLYSRRNLRSAYYLPADRGGIMHAYSAVARAFFRGASRPGLRAERRVFSGILGDFLEELAGMDEPGTRRTKSRKAEELAKGLEERILGGSVGMGKFKSNHPSFFYSPKGWKDRLPLMNSSSMVSELAPVALYLRHCIKPGDLLILEEPEAHLHPDIQQEFTEEIASWIDRKVRVILTTHSEWVLEKLSNMVARSVIGKETGPGVLKEEDVGVWLFDWADPKNRNAGSKIREVEWKEDNGGYEADFYDVAIKMQNEWAKIINAASNKKIRK